MRTSAAKIIACALLQIMMLSCENRSTSVPSTSQTVATIRRVWLAVPKEGKDPKTYFYEQAGAVSNYVKEQWPKWTDEERSAVLSSVKRFEESSEPSYEYHLQYALLITALEFDDDATLRELFSRMDIDTLGYTPLEYRLVRDVDESRHLHRLTLLCVRRAAGIGQTPTAAEYAIRSALAGVCPEYQSKSPQELCQWMKTNWDSIRVDPEYKLQLRRWDGISEAPPLLVTR
jgi:hypothetical protein